MVVDLSTACILKSLRKSFKTLNDRQLKVDVGEGGVVYGAKRSNHV